MLDDSKRREELGDFLRTRRARLTPAEAGLPASNRRRTPGLRREEVAALAGIGVTWYTWLERGRDIRPSEQVLENIARALHLDGDERSHLYLLAQPERLPQRPEDEVVSPALQRVLDNQHLSPAFILGRRWDILAWNAAAAAVWGYDATTPEERNGIWRMFANPELRRLYVDWEAHAQLRLSQFRATAARYPGDPSFLELIEALKRVSPEFREWWPRHEVRGRPGGLRELNHPTAGRLDLELTTFQVHDTADLTLQLYMPVTGTDTAAKLQLLIGAGHAGSEDEGSPALRAALG